jgi:hypothetical protein
MMSPNLIVSILFATLYFNVSGQSNTTAAGGDASGSGGTVAYSLGQVSYIVASGNGGTANQGVQQAFEIFTIGSVDEQFEVSISIFPNPTLGYLNLEVLGIPFEKLTYQIFSSQGKLILMGNFTGSHSRIDLGELPAATYTMQIINSNHHLRTYKVIKNH